MVNPPGGESAGGESAGGESAGGESAGHPEILVDMGFLQKTVLSIFIEVLTSNICSIRYE